jgi:hypothetical protein
MFTEMDHVVVVNGEAHKGEGAKTRACSWIVDKAQEI